jgi:hypothetical protein
VDLYFTLHLPLGLIIVDEDLCVFTANCQEFYLGWPEFHLGDRFLFVVEFLFEIEFGVVEDDEDSVLAANCDEVSI